MNHKFQVDIEKCIKCGLCTMDCPTGAIVKDENNVPIMKNPLNCMKCQHCFAICPQGAISIMGKNPDESNEIKNINPDDVLNLIQSRRSVRHFKHDNVSKEIIEKLKNMLNYSPTGKNSHALHFSFVENVDVMDDLRKKVNAKLATLFNKKPFEFLGKKINKFDKHKDAILNGEDVIFRNAPHMVVVSAPVNSPCPQQDGVIALSYFELYANSLGLGTLWCGYAQAILKMFPSFCEYLRIPEGYMPVYVMLFGNSAINYKRTIQPNPYQFIMIEKQELEKDIWKNIKRTFWNFIR